MVNIADREGDLYDGSPRAAQRWQIEVMHKVLKSGCRIEERQLESAARLKRALMVDLVVAW
ncbi:MAG: hypothetical protein ACREIA_20400, partial [Opitutaceae bacterium]